MAKCPCPPAASLGASGSNCSSLQAAAQPMSISRRLAIRIGPPPPRERSDDGTTLDGWESPPPALWRVQDGCITGGDGTAKIPYNDFLCTKASYENFVLRLKIKLTGDPATGFINSGVQIRTARNTSGHEVCG